MTWIYVLFCVLFCGSTTGFLLDTITGHLPHQVCYGDLGCFSNGIPFLSTHRPLSVVPASPDTIGTRFLLYTRATPTITSEEQLDPKNDLSISRSHFDGQLATKIIVHGFTHDGHKMWVQNMTRELLVLDAFNVIVVDWHAGAVLPYEQATANTRVVGAQLAQLINTLIARAGTSAGKFHIIGHSLGAHIAGYAGERITHLGRISGLDPASPYFEDTDIKVRLDPSDADFVDVMHTDAGGVKNIGFGATHPLGHVDFYPNGGERQPGCAADAVDKLGATSWAALSTFFNVYAAEEALACSHERSYYYFTESINSQCPFTAWKCATLGEFDQGHCVKCTDDSCARMGYHADPSKGLRGNFYLNTESTDSFCQYTYQVNISSLNNFDGILYMTLEGTNATIGPTALMKNNLVHLGKDTLALRYHSRVNVGSPTHLTLRYEKITTPFISSSYPDDWHLLGVTLWQADESRKYSFCNTYHAEIDNHNSTTFSVRGVTC